MNQQELFAEMREYAAAERIPIMEEDGMLFCADLVRESTYKEILEVGTAIAYWSMQIASLRDDIHITTLERDLVRYEKAQDYLAMSELKQQIDTVLIDAKDFLCDRRYDLIFLDAAKAQNEPFFYKFAPFLNDNGIVIVDNMSFHGFVEHFDELKHHRRNLRHMVGKIIKFKERIMHDENFECEELSIGDGILLIRPKQRQSTL